MRRTALRGWGTSSLASLLLMAAVTTIAYWNRDQLVAWHTAEPHLMVALVIGAFVWLLAGLGLLGYERSIIGRAWRARLVARAGYAEQAMDSPVRRWRRRVGDPLEFLTGPLLRTAWGRTRSAEWQSAGFGDRASRYLLLLGSALVVGALVGYALAGPLLGLAFGLTLPLAPGSWVRRRAIAAERRFDELLPEALDAIASGLAAGLAFEGAVGYAATELPKPVAARLAQLARRLSLGIPVDEALDRLLEEQPGDQLALIVEAIQLQRRLGGNLIELLKEMAGLIRERIELAKEVRAVSAQGRLSGSVIAGLVPVSAGILLLFNPRYIDVLFETLLGQVLLVISLLLLLAGWAVMSMLIRRAV